MVLPWVSFSQMFQNWRLVNTSNITHKLNRITSDDRCPYTFVAPCSTTKFHGLVTSLKYYASAHAASPATSVYLLLSGC